MVVWVGLCIGYSILLVIVEGKGQLWEVESLGLSIVTNGMVHLKGGDAALPR